MVSTIHFPTTVTALAIGSQGPTASVGMTFDPPCVERPPTFGTGDRFCVGSIMVGQQVIEEAIMDPVTPDQLETVRPGGEDGPLSRESQSLRQRAVEVRSFTGRLPSLSDAQGAAALTHIRVVIDHIAGHGAAEEHILYPYLGECAEVAALRADHVRMAVLARAIHEWTPAHGRVPLHSLLDEFTEISDSHLLVEGEVCMPVVHQHVVSGAEQLLFEAVEIDVFDRAVTASVDTIGR